MNKIKISILIILAVLLGIFYTVGCLPGLGLSSADSQQSASDTEISAEENSPEEEGSDIDSKLIDLKKGLVSAPVILSHVSGEQLFGSGDKELVFLRGLAEAGNTIEIYVNSILEQDSIIVGNGGKFETLNGIKIIEGKNIIELIAIDPSGRKSNSTKFSLLLNVPQKVEYSLYNNSIDLEIIEGIYYTEENKPQVYLKGTYIPGSNMYIQANDRIIGEAISDENGFFIMENISLYTGDNEIAVWAITPDDYISSPVFNSIKVFKDIIAPYPSKLTGNHNGGANYINWAASIDDNFDVYKIVRVEDPCINPEYPLDDTIATIIDQSSTSYVDDDLEDGRSYYYTIWTLDRAGHAVSSNVLALPKPVYNISISKVEAFTDYSVGRREWFYQYYEITNTGNVTLDIQPIMAWIKLDPNPNEDMEITPLWEVHLWDPDNPGVYYYSDEEIYQTYVSDWVATSGHTTVETEEVIDYASSTKTVTVTETTKKTENNDVNLKRIMTVDTVVTITTYDITTSPATETGETVTYDTSTEVVEPERIGNLIENLQPGEKIKLGVKIQNVSAANNEEITVHFHFAPVDCDEHFFIDEIVSTGDIYCKSSGRS
ncbi:MAG TPA: hypothetical protein DCP02_04020 [Actinobacteria bacterium]|nr:hypothetical protein [Actinomycetota bacterium]